MATLATRLSPAVLALLAITVGPYPSAAKADLIFSDANYNNVLFRSTPSDDPVTFVSDVARNTAVTNIGVLDTLTTSGHVKFLIYDLTLSALEYISAPKAFAADSTGPTWKVSDAFSFTLLAGHQYFIGGVSDAGNLAPFQYPPIDHTEDGITSDGMNGGFTYDGTYEGQGASGVPLRLYGPAAVPEPSTLALAGLGLVSVVLAKWRNRARA